MIFDGPDERALFYRAGSSDRVYLIQMFEGRVGPEFRLYWIVRVYWGPRGQWGPSQNQTKKMTGRLDAEKEFNKLIISKVNKGYRIGKREELPGGYPRKRLGDN